MQQRTLGKTGFQVSALTLGGGGIGMVWGPTTDEECVETVKYAVASGINILDLAPVYGTGKAEEIVGQAWRELATTPLIATKVFVLPEERKDLSGAVQRSLEGSLNRLGLSRIDVFQLHNQIEPQEPTAPRRLTLREVIGAGGVLDAMQKLKDAGVVKALGFTGIARHDVVRELFADGRLETVQLVTNILCSEGEMGARADAPYRDHLQMVRCLLRRWNALRRCNAPCWRGSKTARLRFQAEGHFETAPCVDKARVGEHHLQSKLIQ